MERETVQTTKTRLLTEREREEKEKREEFERLKRTLEEEFKRIHNSIRQLKLTYLTQDLLEELLQVPAKVLQH